MIGERLVGKINRGAPGDFLHCGIHAGDIKRLGNHDDRIGDAFHDQIAVAQLMFKCLGGPPDFDIFRTQFVVGIGEFGGAFGDFFSSSSLVLARSLASR